VRVLGVVDWTGVDKSGQAIAGVSPLFEVMPSGWRSIDAAKEFPTNGLAFWFRAEAAKGELIFFRSEENPGGKDYEFKVTEHDVASEVRDFRKLGPPETVRLALTAGLKWRDPATGRALLWCADDVVVGPMRLIATETGLLTFEHPQKHEIPCYASKEIEIKEVPFSPAMRFVLAEDCRLIPSSYVDWDSDKLVARRAITWAVDRSKQAGNGIELTRNQIRDAAAYLTNSGDDAKLKLEQYRLQRTLRMFAEIQAADEAAVSAVEALQNYPSIARGLELLRDEVKVSTADAVRQTLEVEQEAIASAKLEREQLQVEIINAQARIESLREQMELEIQEIDLEVEKRVSEILRKPAELLAEVAILRSIFRGSAPPVNRVDGRQSTPNISSMEWPIVSNPITGYREFRSALVKSAAAAAVPVTALLRIHAAFSSGAYPFLGGPHAMKALEAYARTACGGRIFRVHIPPNFFVASDVFGKLDVGSRRFSPHAAGLIDILRIARSYVGFALVVLEGANRAPIESYLLPLLDSIAGDRYLRLFHQASVSIDDPYREMHHVQWPSNLLLAATVVEGATTLPISLEIWSRGLFIETDGDVPLGTTLPEVSDIACDKPLSGLPEERIGITDVLLESLPEYGPFRGLSERFISNLSRFEPDDQKLERAFLETILLPIAITSTGDEEVSEALARLSNASNALSADEMQHLARRLRRRIM
jgi:hypothetical protein